MAINIDGFINFYSKLSDNFRASHEQFFSYWNSIPDNTPILCRLNREPYVRTKPFDGYDALANSQLKANSVEQINKYSNIYNLSVKTSLDEPIELVNMKILEFSRQLLERDKFVGAKDFNNIIDKEYFEKRYSISASEDFISSITRKELTEASSYICDEVNAIYREISSTERYIEFATKNRAHIISLFAGRKINLINGDFDINLVKKITSKNLGFKYTKHTSASLICRLIETILKNNDGVRDTAMKQHISTHAIGSEFEKEIAMMYMTLGYETSLTSASGDFGIDVIAESNAEKIGIQCKKLSNPVGVDAVMQVHSGGKFYDCTRYCIITTTGYTAAAEEMATKLGVEILIRRNI